MENNKMAGIAGIVLAIIVVALIGFICFKDKKPQVEDKKESNIALTEDEKTAIRSEIDSLNAKIHETNSIEQHEVKEILERSVLSGEAGKFEKAAKEYIKNANTKLWDVSKKFSDTELSDLLTVENIDKDAPDFIKSIDYIRDTKKQLEEKFKETSEYLEVAHMEDYYTEKGLSEANRDFFRELIVQGNDYLRAVTSTSLKESMEKATTILDQELKIFELLKDNKGKWNTKGGSLKFTDSELEKKYVKIVTKMK